MNCQLFSVACTRCVLALAGLMVAYTANATDPVSLGTISGLTYRGGYVMFQLISGTTNSCAPCPGDPGAYAPGSFCWIPTSNAAQMSVLLVAKAEGLAVSGRVTGITTDCTVYQMTVAD